MNLKLPAASITAILSLSLGLPAGGAAAEVTPVRHVDVIVKNKTDGMTLQTITTREGKFVFDNLEPGKYQLRVDVTDAEQPVNAAKAETKHTSATAHGVQTDEVSIAYGAGKDAQPPAPVEIEITAMRGKISGVVTTDAPAKK